MQPRAAMVAVFGEADTIQVVPHDVPTPGAGEVRIRVEASSIQFTDTVIRRGIYPERKEKPPFSLGYDLVGLVDQVGPGVDDLSIGDRVADLCVTGGNACYAIRPATSLVPVPDRVDAAQATTLVLSWMTAQQCLFRVGRLQPGQRVLIVGGGGAVGLAACALAGRTNLEAYATASVAQHDELRALGVTPLPRSDWEPAIQELGGVDLVLDGVAARGFRSSYGALREGGRLIGLGQVPVTRTGWCAPRRPWAG